MCQHMSQANRQTHMTRNMTGWFVVTAFVLLLGSSAFAMNVVANLERVPHEAIVWSEEGFTRALQSTQPLQGGVTVRSQVTIGPSGVAQEVDEIYLGTLASASGGDAALSLVWTRSVSGWGFIVWNLELRSELGLLPGQQGSAALQRLELTRAVPVAGHTYDAYLSYNPEDGSVSVSLLDVTDSRVVYRGGTVADVYADPLFASTGYKGDLKGRPASLTVDGLDVMSAFLPVGADWTTGLISDSNALLPAWRFSFDEDFVVRLSQPTGSVDGTFRLVSEGRDSTRVLGTFTDLGPDTRLSIPASELPLGTSTLVLEYLVDGHVYLSDVRQVTTGNARFQFGAFDVDANNGEVTAVLTITSDAVMDDLYVTVAASLSEMIWDETVRNYVREEYRQHILIDGPLDISPDGLPIGINVPIPDDPGMWEIAFTVDTQVKIGTEAFNTQKLFTTYPPADPKPGESFTIAVLPDTQYYAQDHHVILPRQLQWIAENAHDRNILLTLHLGDLTDDNTPVQWNRVTEAFGLLEDIMPYMIAQGNHDMTANGGGQAADRVSTRINQYFPVESMPWVRGTYPEGRIENSYATFEFQGERFLIVSLEFGPRDEALEWANDVVSAHPDHTTIMITHSNINSAGNRTESAAGYPIAQNPDTTVNGANAVWNKFTRNHQNLLLTLSGHIHSNAIPRRVSAGRYGNLIYEMLMDYQSDPNGGNGFLVTMEFHPDNTIEIRAYSPYLGEYRTEVDQRGFTNHFMIERGSSRFINR